MRTSEERLEAVAKIAPLLPAIRLGFHNGMYDLMDISTESVTISGYDSKGEWVSVSVCDYHGGAWSVQVRKAPEFYIDRESRMKTEEVIDFLRGKTLDALQEGEIAS